MNIVVLSRGPGLYSTQSLMAAGEKRGHQMRIIDHTRCNLIIEKNMPQIYYEGMEIGGIDAIIPRVGSSVTYQGSAVIQQFEVMDIFSTCQAESLLKARNKLKSLQLLAKAGLGMPKTAFNAYIFDANELIQSVGGVPVVIKLLNGTHGIGVILANDHNVAESVIETFIKTKQRVLVQEFIKEASGADIRALVVDGEVVAAMKRKARAGEFRSNLHRGGSSIHIKLTSAEEQTALAAVKALGLGVAGVDMLQSDRGPLILEVNPSPGLEGIETTTNIDIAGKIIQYIEREVAKKKNN